MEEHAKTLEVEKRQTEEQYVISVSVYTCVYSISSHVISVSVYTCVCQTEEQYVISVSVYTCVRQTE